MTWGLALSAGAAHGLANAGVLEVFEEHGLRPDAIAASSMGALVGALYALGLPTTVYRDIAKTIRLTNVAKVSPHPLEKGLHGGLLRQRLSDHLQSLVGNATIGDCKIPFYCVAGRVLQPIHWERMLEKDFGTYVASCIEEHVFPLETPLLDALMASSAIPVVFSPVTIGENSFIDICNFGAVPVHTLRKRLHPNVVIATNTVPTYRSLARLSPAFLRDWLSYTERCLQDCLCGADFVISPKPAAPAFRFDRMSAFMASGRKAAEEALTEIHRLIG